MLVNHLTVSKFSKFTLELLRDENNIPPNPVNLSVPCDNHCKWFWCSVLIEQVKESHWVVKNAKGCWKQKDGEVSHFMDC